MPAPLWCGANELGWQAPRLEVEMGGVLVLEWQVRACVANWATTLRWVELSVGPPNRDGGWISTKTRCMSAA